MKIARALALTLIALLVIAGLWSFAKRPVSKTGNPVNDEEPAGNDKIKVFYPLPNGMVSSPLVVRGEARGIWYFEASFPARLEDGNGKVLVQHYAQAEGDWMTENFVRYKSTLVFSKPTTATGTLVLEKDNPSGDPARAEELRIPVRF